MLLLCALDSCRELRHNERHNCPKEAEVRVREPVVHMKTRGGSRGPVWPRTYAILDGSPVAYRERSRRSRGEVRANHRFFLIPAGRSARAVALCLGVE